MGFVLALGPLLLLFGLKKRLLLDVVKKRRPGLLVSYMR